MKGILTGMNLVGLPNILEKEFTLHILEQSPKQNGKTEEF